MIFQLDFCVVSVVKHVKINFQLFVYISFKLCLQNIQISRILDEMLSVFDKKYFLFQKLAKFWHKVDRF